MFLAVRTRFHPSADGEPRSVRVRGFPVKASRVHPSRRACRRGCGARGLEGSLPEDAAAPAIEAEHAGSALEHDHASLDVGQNGRLRGLEFPGRLAGEFVENHEPSRVAGHDVDEG
jgi:hypothetical protein